MISPCPSPPLPSIAQPIRLVFRLLVCRGCLISACRLVNTKHTGTTRENLCLYMRKFTALGGLKEFGYERTAPCLPPCRDCNKPRKLVKSKQINRQMLKLKLQSRAPLRERGKPAPANVTWCGYENQHYSACWTLLFNPRCHPLDSRRFSHITRTFGKYVR